MALIRKIRLKLELLWVAMTLKPMAGAEEPPAGGGDQSGGSGDAGGGSGDDGGSGDEGATGGAAKGGDAGDAGGSGDDDDDEPTEEQRRIRAEASKLTRRYENERKKAEKRAEAAEKKLREREDQDKSEQEKAIEKARKEGEESASKAAAAERRKDRLESAVIRTAAKGIRVGEGEKAKTLKFADPEDALLHLERAIARGDVDSDDVFDSEGKVKSSTLTAALGEILEEKPYLQQSNGDEPPRREPQGSADGGKGGDGEAGKTLEEMTPEEHFERIRRHKS